MKKKKTNIGPMERGYVSGSELSLEIKHTEELLQASCHWALSLAEGVEGFEDTFLETVGYLESLEEAPLAVEFDASSIPRIRSILRKIRNYCRRMATEGKPLSVIGIVEDLQELEAYTAMLRKLTGPKKDKGASD